MPHRPRDYESEDQQFIASKDIEIDANRSPHFYRLQVILLKYILGKTSKFSRQNDWYLASVIKGMSPEENQEHFEEFACDPFFTIQDDFDIEYYQLIENLAFYFNWPYKERLIEKLSGKDYDYD